MDTTNVCRLCGKDAGKYFYKIFDKNEYGQQILQMINKCIPVLVYRNDPFTKDICQHCYDNLHSYCQWIDQCISVQNNLVNNNNLILESDPDNIKLYKNVLENHQTDFLRTINVYHEKPEKQVNKIKNNKSQVSNVEIDPHVTRGKKRLSLRNMKVLTPEIINELNVDSKAKVTAVSKDGRAVKKRKLAGPKSLTKNNIIRTPPSLLQCALQKINQINCPHIPLKDLSTLNETYELEKPKKSTYSHSNKTKDIFTYSYVDPNTPATCNYCFKNFNNLIDLAKHELGHIKACVGPRVEDKKYVFKYRHYGKLYRESIQRIENEIYLEENGLLNPGEQEYDPCGNSSLLVPQASHVEHVFEVIDNEINVDGKPLKDYDKTERRNFYKSINIDGVKRKFCPICRHTFKDNWAIDIHYLNSSCQYTCKYCGLKFKFHKDLYPEHMKSHEGEPCNKIFGPADRKTKFKRRKVLKMNRFGNLSGMQGVIPPKIKPIKMKQLMMKKSIANMVKVKQEPGVNSDPGGSTNATNTDQPGGNIQPYQAYFCRKCFKVFFKIDEFNIHTAMCKGGNNTDTESISSESTTKRPQRSCVKDFPVVQDSDSESNPGNWSPKPGSGGPGFECGICCSSFPSRHSRNSHMRIHKGQEQQIHREKFTFIPQTASSPVVKFEPQQPPQQQTPPTKPQSEAKVSNIRLANLNPTVARLVQNNPHLTIRSYTKSASSSPAPDAPSPVEPEHSGQFDASLKKAYRCADCNGKFENKSLLYYHKLNTCVVKRHYECAFCRKKFGSQEHYNTHMLYVHPE